MLKSILVLFLSLFFIFNGVNHYVNPKVLEEYLEKRSYKNNELLVRISGFFLVLGGTGLLVPYSIIQSIASVGLAIFVLLAAFLVHSFWLETNKHIKLLEIQNFIKNFVIFFEMLYLASTF